MSFWRLYNKLTTLVTLPELKLNWLQVLMRSIHSRLFNSHLPLKMFSIFFREPFLPPCWLREIFQVSWKISYLYRQWPVFLYECQFTMFYFWPFLMISFFINPDKSCFASLQHLYMYKKIYFLIFKYLFYYFLPIFFLTQKNFPLITFLLNISNPALLVV